MILMSKKTGSIPWKKILTIVTFLALFLLAFAVREQLGQTLSNLKRVNVYLILMIIPLQVMNYYSQGKLYQGLFRILGERFRTRSMMRLALELNFVNTVFPSGGVSGFSYLSLRLKSEKISTAQATLVQMMRFVMIFIGFQALLFAGLLMLALGGRANDLIILIASSLGTMMLLGTALLTYIIGSKRRINTFFTFITRVINKLVHVFHRSNPEFINIDKAKSTFDELHENYMHIRRNLSILKAPLFFAVLAGFTEIFSIYVVYLAFGEWVNMGAVILAYAVANFAGLVSILPGGVGIYEGLMTVVLAAGGVPPALSLPVTVMYRVVSMGVQLPPGYYFYQRNIHADTPEEIDHEAIKPEGDES
jgi:uncharacterized protein (TIRG00374 family)